MRISGVQKLSMVDYPGKLAAVVFTGGCNLRCPYCHNAALVTRVEETPALAEAEVLDFLRSRRGFLDGVVLSGGEPLLQAGAADFLERVRNMGYAVKVDTNGCFPKVLEDLFRRGLADYVAMDIKNCREKYAETVGLGSFDLAPVEESIRLIRASGVDYEFRTTVVREFHTAEDLRAIGQWLHGAKRYFLHRFVDSGDLVGPPCHAFSAAEMRGLLAAAEPFFGEAGLRGVE